MDEKCKDPNCTCEDCTCKEENNTTCECENNDNTSVLDNKESKSDKKRKKDKHLDKLNEAYNQMSILEDALIRSKAELVNYRKRKDDEMSKMLKYANEDIVLEILPTIDNFERAIKLDDVNLSDELSKFLEGFKMIYCSLVNTVEKFDVKIIDGYNKPFDPSYHQAVLTAKVDNVEAGMVIEVLQKGYLYKDKVIRPAMVKVSE